MEKGASHQIWAHYGDDSVGEQQLFRDDVSAQRQRQLVHPRHLPGQYLVFDPASGRLPIVPEPSTWVLAAIGAAAVGLKARRRSRAA